MRNNDILYKYETHLYEKVENDSHDIADYSKLLDTLFRIPFRSYIYMDNNRMEDASDMRFDYISELFNSKEDTSIIEDRYISVLEVLIALAIRMEKDILCDPMSENDHSSDHFWVFLRNLGVENDTNDDYFEENVRKKCEIWMTREYDFNGNGSIFPLKGNKNDARKMEIWTQMNIYILENY